MINGNFLKKTAEKYNKKLSKSSKEGIKAELEKTAEKIIEKAARNADLAGRIIIKKEDIII